MPGDLRLIAGAVLLLTGTALVCVSTLREFERAPAAGLLRPLLLLPAALVCMLAGVIVAR